MATCIRHKKTAFWGGLDLGCLCVGDYDFACRWNDEFSISLNVGSPNIFYFTIIFVLNDLFSGLVIFTL